MKTLETIIKWVIENSEKRKGSRHTSYLHFRLETVVVSIDKWICRHIPTTSTPNSYTSFLKGGRVRKMETGKKGKGNDQSKKQSQTFLQHRLKGDHVEVNVISIVRFSYPPPFWPAKNLLCQIRLFFLSYSFFWLFFFFAVVDFSNFPKDS